MIPFLELKPAYLELKDQIDAAVARSLDSGWYIGGGEVSSFETAFAKYVGAQHCVAVGNGLDALALALLAHNIGPGDEVLVPSHTFIATWLGVTKVGATIVPIEPCGSTFNLDLNRVEESITPRTKAIMPVHLYGRPVDMDALNEIAKRHGLMIIEDAAQAHGATIRGLQAGSFGNIACWSFYPGKNLGAFGDGGAVTTDSEDLAHKVRMLGNYGSSKKYVHELQGINSRLDPIQAAILEVKLSVLDDWNGRRKEIATRYRDAFTDSGLLLQKHDDDIESSNHLFVVRHSKRDELAANLLENGVKTLIHYPTACRDQLAYSSDSTITETPIASKLAGEILSLPIGPHFSDDQVSTVIEQTIKIAKTL